GLLRGRQRGVGGERLADRVDQPEPRAEVLVESRAGDPGAARDVLDARLVERALREELADGAHDPAARVVGLLGSAPLPVRPSIHWTRSLDNLSDVVYFAGHVVQ